jgi:hypothetical protein
MTVPTQQELAVEMTAFFQRIQEQKAAEPQREPFQITQTVVTLHTPAGELGPADHREINTYAGDQVPNPDAQGL